jgi:hypothetical protein
VERALREIARVFLSDQVEAYAPRCITCSAYCRQPVHGYACFRVEYRKIKPSLYRRTILHDQRLDERGRHAEIKDKDVVFGGERDALP